ncbi:MAG: T9SS type A sorting domain-containing protein [Reichenbachiella sp.]
MLESLDNENAYILRQLLVRVKIILSLIVLTGLVNSCAKVEENNQVEIAAPKSAIGTSENPNARIDFEIMQVADPATKEIPVNIYKKELSFARQLSTTQSRMARVKTSEWSKAGPDNVGGRTRALGMDVRNDDILLAGGVSGGMYRSEDGGDNWTRTSLPSIVNSISCLVQDSRVGFQDHWYFGTGELKGNSARAAGAPYRGDGIYHSSDNGQSWEVLPSTANDRLTDFESPFNYVWNLAIGDAGEIYAALYGCVVKSVDDGGTWSVVLGPDLLNSTLVDLNDSGAPFYTNVLLADEGVLYATLSSFSSVGYSLGVSGFYRSEDGANSWEKILPPRLPLEFDRTVMAHGPIGSGVLYFLTESTSTFFWKYDNGVWDYRTQNLPGIVDTLAAYNSQDSYNMSIGVHPDDEDVVFIGGTNLYRSDNGFRTGDQTYWIGGYNPESESNGAIYANHHPDQHAMLFYPSDGNKMLTANDGGVQYTSDGSIASPNWSKRNDGYITSQFYSIALSKVDGEDIAMGGLQDNGSYIRSSGVNASSWNSVLGGDGGYSAATPQNKYWYVSFQNAQIFRLSLDRYNDLEEFAEVDPSGVDRDSYLFINPYILDPNNFNRMYLAAGGEIWRNDNLSQIAPNQQETTEIGWSKIESVELEVPYVSALEVSTDEADILYFGTSFGAIYKTTDANSDLSKTTPLFQWLVDTDDGQVSGYVSSVSIDPSNQEQVIISYSNYHFPSVFLTKDGGITFQDVSGNLEENPDGSGNGPSVRWVEIIPLQGGVYMYLAGTSIGLYSTQLIDGANTVWIKEASETLGNASVRMIDYRSSDGTVVVATHGSGVYDARISNTLPIVPFSSDGAFSILSAYPNPMTEQVKILFSIPEINHVTVDIHDQLGRKVLRLLDDEQFPGEAQVSWDGRNANGTPVVNGIYYCRIAYDNIIKTEKILVGR